MTCGAERYVPMLADMQKMTSGAENDLLTSRDVMERLFISRRTLERYVADGKLQAAYLPSGHRRYRLSDVDALLSPTRTEAGAA